MTTCLWKVAGLPPADKPMSILHCIVWLLLVQYIHAQACPTLPCSQDVTIYDTAPPDDPLRQGVNANPPKQDYPKESPSEPPKESAKEAPKQAAKQAPQEVAKAPAQQPPQQLAKAPAEQPAEQPAKEPAKEPVKEPAKEPVKQPAEQPPQQLAKEPAKEPTKEPAKDPAKEPEKQPLDDLYVPSSSPPSGTQTTLPLPTFLTSSSPTITSAPTSGFPSNSLNATSASSCGQCSVLAQKVSVYFWPTGSVKTTCSRGLVSDQATPTTEAPASITAAAKPTGQFAYTDAAGGGIDVVDGMTL